MCPGDAPIANVVPSVSVWYTALEQYTVYCILYSNTGAINPLEKVRSAGPIFDPTGHVRFMSNAWSRSGGLDTSLGYTESSPDCVIP